LPALAAIPRLRALRHLDLQVIRVNRRYRWDPNRPARDCLTAMRRLGRAGGRTSSRLAFAGVSSGPPSAGHGDRERSCASAEIEPLVIEPGAKRLTIFRAAGSTSAAARRPLAGAQLEEAA